MTAIWENQLTLGSTPHSREGATTCLIGNNIYLFGGFARDIYSDFRCLDRSENKWTVIETKQQRSELPPARYSHSMVNYKNQIAIFGGGGTYLNSIPMRLCLGDLYLYDLSTNKWEEIIGQNFSGVPRMNHVSSLYGCLMLV
jgi:N-acetylneuraminic acid mutarotase